MSYKRWTRTGSFVEIQGGDPFGPHDPTKPIRIPNIMASKKKNKVRALDYRGEAPKKKKVTKKKVTVSPDKVTAEASVGDVTVKVDVKPADLRNWWEKLVDAFKHAFAL